MSQYSIKDLERLSGIKAHTIRIWEQRYGIITPNRTDTNIRHYTSAELKRVLNISVLNNHGWKISKIALMSSQQIEEEVRGLVDTVPESQDIMDSLVMSMIDLDEERFEYLINTSIHTLGFLQAIEKVVYPFFEKIGILWQIGTITPAQEHFISNLVRQKIIVAIDSVPTEYKHPKGKMVMFLREGELHEIALLVQYYIAKQNGYKVYYLGQSVPYEDVLKVVADVNASKVATVFTSPFPEDGFEDFLKQISHDLSGKTVYISGFLTKDLPSNSTAPIKVLKSISQFQNLL